MTHFHLPWGLRMDSWLSLVTASQAICALGWKACARLLPVLLCSILLCRPRTNSRIREFRFYGTLEGLSRPSGRRLCLNMVGASGFYSVQIFCPERYSWMCLGKCSLSFPSLSLNRLMIYTSCCWGRIEYHSTSVILTLTCWLWAFMTH